MARQRVRKRPIAEINVVPYIDVMLVLLVIFMITAPLLTQGVKVDLPEAPADPLNDREQEPVIVTVDAAARFYLNYGNDPEQPIDSDTLVNRINALLRYRPGTPVLVKGDRTAAYGNVVAVMALLKQAGVPRVGLVTEVLETTKP